MNGRAKRKRKSNQKNVQATGVNRVVLAEGEFNSRIPNDVLQLIFSYLTPQDLSKAGKVCKLWNEVSNRKPLWNNLIDQHFHVSSLRPKAMFIELYKTRQRKDTLVALAAQREAAEHARLVRLYGRDPRPRPFDPWSNNPFR